MDEDPIFPFAEAKASAVKLAAAAHYYEWNEQNQKWEKLVPNDPDPPPTLPKGLFDGQITEVRRPNIDL